MTIYDVPDFTLATAQKLAAASQSPQPPLPSTPPSGIGRGFDHYHDLFAKLKSDATVINFKNIQSVAIAPISSGLSQQDLLSWTCCSYTIENKSQYYTRRVFNYV